MFHSCGSRMHSKRRLAVRIAALAVLATALIGGALAVPAIALGVAYKAKIVCSGLFVSRQSADAVIGDLQLDDLKPLRAVRAAIDPRARSVTASAVGLLRRKASYRAGQGCALNASPVAAADPEEGDRGPDVHDFSVAAVSPRLEAVLDEAFAESSSGPQRRTKAVVIVHHGVIVAERYRGLEVGPQTPLPGWSMAKSVVNALIGIMIAEGRLSLDEPPPLQEWQQGGDARAAITVSQLLRMSSGLRFNEGMTSPNSDIMRMLFHETNTAAYAIRQPLEAQPGERWQYSSGTTNILSKAIRSAIGTESDYWAFPRQALFDPVGMQSAVLETDSSGTFVGSSFMYATARDWARFGMLYLQDGVWGARRMLPEGWVSYTTTPAPANVSGEYGAHFWLDVPSEYRRGPDDLPPDAFHAAGHEAQFITIIPSQELVIIRLGRTRYPEAWDHVRFVRNILAALGG